MVRITRVLTLDEAVWTTKKIFFFHTAEITKIISHILIFHAGPITKFILCVPKSRSCHMIDDLIYFLSKNGIQHFVLELPFRDEPHKLPSSFFKCLQLRHLTLQKCLIIPPPAFKGFDRLIRLELCEVTISFELLGSLISNCLLLERLVLHIAYSYCKVIEINAPRLRSFYFAGSIRSIHIKSAPLLEKLLLTDNETGYFGVEKWDIVKFFESFSALEHLCVNMLFAAEVGEMPTRLPFDLSCVKQLYITVDLYDSAEVACALCLIRSLPCIQYMEIQEACCNDSVANHRELPSDVTFNHLKEVKLIFTSGSIIEMQLAKLLLVKSPVLVRMLIESCRAKGTATAKKLVDELTIFQGASPAAEVVFIKR